MACTTHASNTRAPRESAMMRSPARDTALRRARIFIHQIRASLDSPVANRRFPRRRHSSNRGGPNRSQVVHIPAMTLSQRLNSELRTELKPGRSEARSARPRMRQCIAASPSVCPPWRGQLKPGPVDRGDGRFRGRMRCKEGDRGMSGWRWAMLFLSWRAHGAGRGYFLFTERSAQAPAMTSPQCDKEPRPQRQHKHRKRLLRAASGRTSEVAE